ncbi:arginine vasopressin-induced protein 1 [Spea bombifrons]|uniref:arginine vasopressin-induced protein 1 n=1 Tax=Spea bombifrons TaxID=233779 RepID=UPI00234934F2|nr:arginine vasopressin-induced protein 1 [Spea bombifrons]
MGMRLCAWHDREQGGETGPGAFPAPAAEHNAREALTLMPKQCCQSSCSNSSVGTPASVVSSPSAPWQAPAPRARKKASANIFKDIDLLQIQTLFRTSGDECAEERARIICNYAGDRRIADALVKLRRKRRNRSFHQSTSRLSSDRIGTLSVQHFSKLCIRETGHRGSTSTEEDSDQPSVVEEDSQLCETKKRAVTQRTSKKLRNKQQRRITGYLHGIKR